MYTVKSMGEDARERKGERLHLGVRNKSRIKVQREMWCN